MEQKQRRGFRDFVPTRLGRVVLLAVAIVVVFAATAYVSVLIGIPAILVFGLALPIWGGIKAPRYIALSGLVILLLVAPIANVVLTQEIMTPIGLSSSSNAAPTGNNGSVLQAAQVSPYVGTPATNFTWTVTVYPQYVPSGNSTPLWVTLYISNCPGATTNVSNVCTSPFPLIIQNQTGINSTAPETYTFHYQIGSLGIWDWQLSVTVRNNASHALYDIFLVGDPTYNGIEGPVIGSFGDVYTTLLLDVYLEVFLYLGGSFYFVLLIYFIFKRRAQGRADAAQRAAGPPPADAATPSVPSGRGGSGPRPPATAVAAPKEGSCPSCGAVVYAGEKTCWKCGAPLGGQGGSAPLPSSATP